MDYFSKGLVNDETIHMVESLSDRGRCRIYEF